MKRASLKLIGLEQKALDKYKSAISPNRDVNDIVLDISQCSEFLFKSICVIDYKMSETSTEINEPILFLDKKKKFFSDIVDGNFQYRSTELLRIKKASEFINSRGNPEKHTSFQSKEEDAKSSIYVIKSILKWYFKDMYDYNQLELSVDHKKLLAALYDLPDELNSEIQPFDTSTGNYNILILPFRNPDKNYEITSLGENLADGLKAKNNRDQLGFAIRYMDRHSGNVTSEEAKKIRKDWEADIVVWGNDSHPNENLPHHISFHYVAHFKEYDYEGNKIPLEGKTDKLETQRLLDITEGTIHLEIDDFIFWFLGGSFYIKKDFKNALINYKKIKNDKFLNADINGFIAECLREIGSFDEAKNYYKDGLKINPTCYIMNNNYAFLLDRESDFEKAREHYEKALDISPDLYESTSDMALMHNNYAVFLVRRCNPTKAKEHYEKALEINPDFALAHYNYGNLFSDEENYEKAKEHYATAFRINPNDSKSYTNYAFILQKEGELEKAKEHYDIALTIDANDYMAHHNYSNIYISEENYEKAREHCEAAFNINPNFADAHFQYSLLLKQIFDEYEKAKEHYLKAIHLDPKLKNKDDDNFYENI